MTIKEASTIGTAALRKISDAPRLDAQWLLLHILGKAGETSWLYAHAEETLTLEQEECFQRLVAQRAVGTPLAYILGYWGFYGRRFLVNECVLVPRPSTELLVEKALHVMRGLHATLQRPLTVADIGTGSGCIAVTLALEASAGVVSTLYATDISPAALAVAQYNAGLYGVLPRIVFLEGDMLKPLRGRHVDLVVSNPPYLPAEALAHAEFVPTTVGITFEPREALEGGIDGQLFVRRLQASSLPTILESPGGAIQTCNLAEQPIYI